LLGQQAARVMKDQGGGVILYTSSVSALGASRLFSHYAAAKAGVNNLVRNVAISSLLTNHVNGVCPGPLNTQQSVALWEKRR
jgi:3-oxoacyl-[acyl-carrier protein] reductase/7-alpha-hydroxysteroid dehydrogenase